MPGGSRWYSNSSARSPRTAVCSGGSPAVRTRGDSGITDWLERDSGRYATLIGDAHRHISSSTGAAETSEIQPDFRPRTTLAVLMLGSSAR